MLNRVRTSLSFSALCVAALAVGLLIYYSGVAAEPKSEKGNADPTAVANPIASLVVGFDDVEEIKYDWGWIRWLMNSKIDRDAEMTFGIVYVKARQENPAHVHPNCSEILHVLSGSCEHLVGKKWYKMKTGDTVRIPAGVPHRARTLKEPLKAVIVYSSGDRQFELVGEGQKE